MRSKVPAFAVLVPVYFSMSLAFAAGPAPIDRTKFLTDIGCDASVLAGGGPKGFSCLASEFQICAHGAAGCLRKAATSFAPTVGKSTDGADLIKNLKADLGLVKKAKESAAACCSGENVKGCPPTPEHIAAAKTLEGLKPKEGIKAAHETTAAELDAKMRMTASAAGSCKAFREVCMHNHKLISDDAKAATCVASGKCLPTDVDAAASKADAEAATCEGFKADTATTIADDLNKATDDAKQGAKDAGMNPQSGGSNGATNDASSGGSNAADTGAPPGGGMNPQMLMGLAQAAMGMLQQQQTPPVDKPIPPPGDCSSNPALAGCAARGANPGNWETASMGQTRGSQSADSAGFGSLGDGGSLQPASALGANAGATNNNPITTKGIQGGGGGGIPGGGGGGAASLGGGAAGPSAALGGKALNMSITEGGRGAIAAAMNPQSGQSGGGYDYGNRAGANDGFGEGMHLADFLPGGKKDPGRNIAAIGQPVEIQAKSVNIWSRISEHLRSRCAQGLLRDCGP